MCSFRVSAHRLVYVDKITVASVNCRGLGNVQKRRDVFHYLRQKRYSIDFLQDTHLDPKLDKYITAEWGFTSCFHSNNTRSRGVAICFNNDFEFKVKGIFRDNGGNFLMVHINTIKMDVLLVNIYGQHRDDPNFYTNLNERYEIEAYNQKLKLTLPDSLSDWLIINQ